MPGLNVCFRHPSSIICAGPSQSGKTQFCLMLLRHMRLLFDPCPTRVIFVYQEWQEPYAVMKSEGLVDDWIHGNVTFEQLRSLILPHRTKGGVLLVVDDNLDFMGSEAYLKLSSVSIHHYKCSLMTISQSIFYESKTYRICSSNAHYFVLMKTLRNFRDVSTLFSQIRPTKASTYVEIFQKATRLPYSFLVIDLHMASSDLTRLRTNIFPHQKPMLTFIENSD